MSDGLNRVIIVDLGITGRKLLECDPHQIALSFTFSVVWLTTSNNIYQNRQGAILYLSVSS